MPLCRSLEHTGHRMATVGGGLCGICEGKASVSCRYSPLLWKERRRLPPQQTQKPPREQFLPSAGVFFGRAGVGRGAAPVCEPVWAADGRASSSAAAPLCHSEWLDFIFPPSFKSPSEGNLWLHFFFSAQVLECISQTQTYPTS